MEAATAGKDPEEDDEDGNDELSDSVETTFAREGGVNIAVAEAIVVEDDDDDDEGCVEMANASVVSVVDACLLSPTSTP